MTHKARKRFGQHFLIDETLIHQTIHRFAPRSNECIVEIGPGQGALTFPLLKVCQTLHAIELDRDLIPILESAAKGIGELSLHQMDVLKFDFRSFGQTHGPLRLIGNLPYNISTPLLFHLFGALDVIKDMVFMVQKEVADRLCAPPGGKSNGRLGIMAQYYCEISHWFHVPATAFDPPPKVESAIIYCRPHAQPPYKDCDPHLLNQLVTKAFTMRRKTLQNSLKGQLTPAQIIEAGVDPKARPETLGTPEFVRLTEILQLNSG